MTYFWKEEPDFIAFIFLAEPIRVLNLYTHTHTHLCVYVCVCVVGWLTLGLEPKKEKDF